LSTIFLYAFIFACLYFVNFATPSTISRCVVENAEKLTKLKHIRDNHYIVQQVFQEDFYIPSLAKGQLVQQTTNSLFIISIYFVHLHVFQHKKLLHY